MSFDGLVWLFCGIWLLVVVLKGLLHLARARELAELKEKNPEAWARIKQMEHEKEMMARQAEQQEKERRHRTGLTVASIFARIFLK